MIKQISTNQIKKPKKLITILVIIILLSTAFTVSAKSIDLKNRVLDENEEEGGEPTINILGNQNKFSTRIKEKVSKMQDKIRNLLSNIKSSMNEKINDISLKTKSSSSDSECYFSPIKISSDDTYLNFYTNYNGTETNTPLSLFKTVKVDVDADGDNDISAKLFLSSIGVYNQTSLTSFEMQTFLHYRINLIMILLNNVLNKIMIAIFSFS